ncbi:MAG: TIGR03862 family flavoprotein [Luteolibacter sp.]|nr:TIGR03862 family flavoprotein [Luteolibacter sp.]
MIGARQLAVIGGGPAGLRAAETAALAGVDVTLFDAKPSVGRKFLVAGKGGLNLTHGEDIETFARRYDAPDQPNGIWRELLADFDAAALRGWAAGLGVETFQATSGRVYPKELKAAPLLRRWLLGLKELGVRFEMNHRWSGLVPGSPHLVAFSNGASFPADAVVFAFGGGSWPQTGSDGGWMRVFESLGISCHPLVPANCGWEHPWPPEVLAAAEGKPLKNIVVSAGEVTAIGELMVTRHGIEGGAIYQLGAVLRAMPRPAIAIDFKPTFSHARLVAKMESARRDFLAEARVRWRLSDAAVAILGRKPWQDAAALAHEVKHCVIGLTGPRPLAEAISSAGGVCWRELDAALMVKRFPGIFVAGEMIDWEAPTGGYLMQGCFATGTRAGREAAAWLQTRPPD